MAGHKMLRSVRYAVVLFLVTGSVCVASPAQFANGYSFGDKRSVIEEDTLEELLEGCPDDPVVHWRIKEALQDLDTCIKSTIVDTAILSEGPSGFGSSDQIRQKAKNLCRIYKGMQPCIQDALTALKMCEPDIPVENIVAAYEAGVSVACVRDGEKLAAAITEINQISGPICQRRILLGLENCKVEAESGTGRTITICRRMDCMQGVLNMCGSTKTNVNELINEIRVAVDQYVPCISHASQPASQPHSPVQQVRPGSYTQINQSAQFGPSLFLSAAALVAAFASRLVSPKGFF